jgi:hypothetical protein
MGLGSTLDNLGVRVALGQLNRRYPMLKNALAWLLVPNRKRSLTTIAAVIDVGLRHVDEAAVELCQKGLAFACNVHVSAYGTVAGQLGVYIDSLTASADVVTVGMGLWSIGHALYRKRKGKA